MKNLRAAPVTSFHEWSQRIQESQWTPGIVPTPGWSALKRSGSRMRSPVQPASRDRLFDELPPFRVDLQPAVAGVPIVNFVHFVHGVEEAHHVGGAERLARMDGLA